MDGGRRPTSGTTTSKVKGQGHKVTWSVWAVLVQWPIHRKRIIVVSPKLAGGYHMARATLRTSFKVKRSKVRVRDWLTQTHKMCHIFRMVRNFNLASVRTEDVGLDPHQRQALWPPSSKVKVISSHRLYVSDSSLLCLLNSGSHTILVFPHQTLWQHSDGDSLMLASNGGGLEKNRDSRRISGYDWYGAINNWRSTVQ